MIVYNYLDGPDSDKDTKMIESLFDKDPHVVSRYKYDAFAFVSDCVDFPFVDEKKVETLKAIPTKPTMTGAPACRRCQLT